MKRIYDDVLNHGEIVSNLVAIQIGLYMAYSYQLPSVTLRQHINDCFGWAMNNQRNKFDEFVNAFLGQLLKSMPELKPLVKVKP